MSHLSHEYIHHNATLSLNSSPENTPDYTLEPDFTSRGHLWLDLWGQMVHQDDSTLREAYVDRKTIPPWLWEIFPMYLQQLSIRNIFKISMPLGGQGRAAPAFPQVGFFWNFLLDLFILIFVWALCLYVCICTTCVLGNCGSWKRASDPLGLELQMLINHHVDDW